MKTKLLTTAVLAFGISAGAQASLVARTGGMVYDDVNNITWLADANLFQTLAVGNGNLVNDIIAANNGVIYDTPNTLDTVSNSGIYNLTTADFDTSTGTMTWWGAQAWANNLTLGGVTGWTLPTTEFQLGGFDQTGSQMGDLFYNQLGGLTGGPISSSHNDNYNLFSNMQDSIYWSSSQSLPDLANEASDPSKAWVFGFHVGGQTDTQKLGGFNAMAVHAGDVAASTVPVPAAVWLFGSGLIGLASFTRRKNKSANLIAA